jgi:hypothetical protein
VGSCQADLEGSCEARCDEPEGALYCDGNYVDAGNNLEDCVNALRATFDIEVQGYSRGSASCSEGSCVAEGEAGCSCSAVGAQPPFSRAGVWALLVGLGALVVGRRRAVRPHRSR